MLQCVQAAILQHDNDTARRQSSYMRREAQMREQIVELRRRNDVLRNAAPNGAAAPSMQCARGLATCLICRVAR